MAVVQVAMKQETQSPPPAPNPPPSPPPATSGPSTGHVIPRDPLGLEERILTLCAQNAKGITDDIIVQDQPTIDGEKRMRALQRLLSQGKIELLKQGHSLLYKLKATSSTTSKTKGFEKEQRLVYQIIEDSGNKGIWMREIRSRSNITQSELTRCLRTLESRKLIKNVRSVQAARRKLYMLYDITPDESVTGGAWYSDQDFESEFVQILNQQCLKFLEQKAFKAKSSNTDPLSRKSASFATPQEVCKFITELGISRVALTANNIETILNTLVYDGKAESSVVMGTTGRGREGVGGEGVTTVYRLSHPLISDAGLSRVPCGVCPIISECCDEGAISPSSCQYMKQWLQF